MRRTALIVSSPSEAPELFPALLHAHRDRAFILLAVFNDANELDSRRVAELTEFASLLDFKVIPISAKRDRSDRILPESLAPVIREILCSENICECYTHCIQGDKGQRQRADVAYAVSLAANGRAVYHLAKHVSDPDLCFSATPQAIHKLNSSRNECYDLSREEADFAPTTTIHFTRLREVEVKVAYHELSLGFAGVRKLVGDGDSNPWGYETSEYAQARYESVRSLIARHLASRSPMRIIEVGGAAGSMTNHILNSQTIEWLRVLEPFDEFRKLLSRRFFSAPNVRIEPLSIEENTDWTADVVLLCDCLYFLSEEEQTKCLLRILSQCEAVVVGGDRSWLENLIRQVSKTTAYKTRAVEHVAGRLEPLRPGFRIHSPRPNWAVALVGR